MRTINSLVKGLKILEAIASGSDGSQVSVLARKFSMPNSNMTLFLNSLIQTGYVIKNPIDKRYYISERIIQIADQIKTSKYAQLEIIAIKEMEKLHKKFDENILLAVLNNYMLQFILTLQSSKNIQILNNDNKSFIPHVTAAGKAILAFLPGERVNEYFQKVKLQRFTPKTHTKKSEVLEELERVRKHRYAINRGEFENEIMAVAAPIFYQDSVLASVAVQFPTFRYKEENLEENAADIMKVTDQISRQLQKQGIKVYK